jgi:hypothetical protein
MSFDQVNDPTCQDGRGEQLSDSKRTDQSENDWAGEALEGSGFEDESPEPGFEWRE